MQSVVADHQSHVLFAAFRASFEAALYVHCPVPVSSVLAGTLVLNVCFECCPPPRLSPGRSIGLASLAIDSEEKKAGISRAQSVKTRAKHENEATSVNA